MALKIIDDKIKTRNIFAQCIRNNLINRKPCTQVGEKMDQNRQNVQPTYAIVISNFLISSAIYYIPMELNTDVHALNC